MRSSRGLWRAPTHHRLAPHIDLARANDLSDVRRVVGLEDGDLDAFFGVEALPAWREERSEGVSR